MHYMLLIRLLPFNQCGRKFVTSRATHQKITRSSTRYHSTVEPPLPDHQWDRLQAVAFAGGRVGEFCFGAFCL